LAEHTKTGILTYLHPSLDAERRRIFFLSLCSLSVLPLFSHSMGGREGKERSVKSPYDVWIGRRKGTWAAKTLSDTTAESKGAVSFPAASLAAAAILGPRRLSPPPAGHIGTAHSGSVCESARLQALDSGGP